MKLNLHKVGHRVELFGLAAIVVAGVWQAKMTDWFDQQLNVWQDLIQQDVNTAILKNQQDIARLVVTEDIAKRKNYRDSITVRADDALVKAFKESDNRLETMNNGQAAIFKTISIWLIFIGSGSIFMGKWISSKTASFEKKSTEVQSIPEPDKEPNVS